MAVAELSLAVVLALSASSLYIFAGNLMAADAGTAASAAPAKLWTVDPAGFEPNLPPAGRSLFDFLTLRKYGGPAEYDIPYPFAALLRKIERQLKTEDSGASGLKRVLDSTRPLTAARCGATRLLQIPACRRRRGW